MHCPGQLVLLLILLLVALHLAACHLPTRLAGKEEELQQLQEELQQLRASTASWQQQVEAAAAQAEAAAAQTASSQEAATQAAVQEAVKAAVQPLEAKLERRRQKAREAERQAEALKKKVKDAEEGLARAQEALQVGCRSLGTAGQYWLSRAHRLGGRGAVPWGSRLAGLDRSACSTLSALPQDV